jgi:hypothetical protein
VVVNITLTIRKVSHYIHVMRISMRRSKVFPGLASASKKLADGTTRKYFYAWRGGPMLRSATGEPLKPGDAGFVEAYAAAHAARADRPVSEPNSRTS